MSKSIKSVLKRVIDSVPAVAIAIDVLFAPLTIISGVWLKLIRTYNIGFWRTRSRVSKVILDIIGVFPIINHYYEPYYSPKSFKRGLHCERKLPGIDLNVSGQLELLSQFNQRAELLEIGRLPEGQFNYSPNKGPFCSGDAEMLFCFIRYFKPRRIVEIGCGHSTLMIQHAISYNLRDDPSYQCDHVCIEPFENTWLTALKITFLKQKVEDVDLAVFESLGANDILFIDSTHVIRPQGDVVFEYLQLLPILKPGVLIHIHDIFTPRDYLDEWIRDGVNYWNEQYLLEAFLTFNNTFEVVSAVNFLKNNHYEKLAHCCPYLTPDREPASFWIRRR